MTHMQHIGDDNAGGMSHGEEPETYPSYGYYGYRPQSNNVSFLQGRNWIIHYGMNPMTISQPNMPDAGLGFYPQERAIHGDPEYRPQGGDFNVFQGHRYASRYGVPRMTNSQSNISHVITSQPAAYADQWIIQTTASGGSNTYDESTQSQSKGWILFKRMISIVFMVIDILMAWVQISEMDKTANDVVFSRIYTESSCPQSQPVIVTYIVVMSFSTLFTIAQIVNVIGETVYDLTEGKHGFQFIHGFNEVVVKTIIKDIPQLLLMFIAVFFKCACTNPVGRWFMFIGVTFAPLVSSTVRQITCKQEVKNWCKCNCKAKCCSCPEECGCECPCLCCYLPISSKIFKPCVPISIFEYLGCSDNGGCKLDCTPRMKDPKFADNVLNHLGNYESVLLALNILVMIVRCDIPFDRWQINFNMCQTLFRC